MSETRTSKSTADEVADQLRHLAKGMREGERLPTVRQLMATFGVGQLTMQKVIGVLAQEGVLTAGVGRGTFVGTRMGPVNRRRDVLVLTREQRTDRSDEIARGMHQEFLKRRWRSAVLTYSDFAQAVELVRNGPRFDASVIHPRLETLPLGLLAALRARSKVVVVEGYAADGIDVDGVAIDWPAAVALGLRHLIDRGHRHIGLVTIDQPTRAFVTIGREFRSLHRWAGLVSGTDPVVLLPPGSPAALYGALELALCARRHTPLSALLMYIGPCHGERLLEAVRQHAPAMAVATLGFTDLVAEHGNLLTTVGQSSHVVTEAVATAVERRWKDPSAAHLCRYIDPVLVVRASTEPPA